MNTISVTKEATFEAAHCLPGHPKCGRIHGHSYKVKVTFEASDAIQHSLVPVEDLNKAMLVDFGSLGTELKAICEAMDHSFLSPYPADTLLDMIDRGMARPLQDILGFSFERSVFGLGMTTTAENLAYYFAKSLSFIFDRLLEPVDQRRLEVTVYETATSCATFKAQAMSGQAMAVAVQRRF